jgi:hypothetical protein
LRNDGLRHLGVVQVLGALLALGGGEHGSPLKIIWQ